MAYIAGILINVVGFAGASECTCLRLGNLFILSAAGRTVPIAATRIYEMSFFTGFGVSMVVYLLLNWAFPVPGTFQTFEEVDVSGWNGSDIDDKSDDICSNEEAETQYPFKS